MQKTLKIVWKLPRMIPPDGVWNINSLIGSVVIFLSVNKSEIISFFFSPYLFQYIGAKYGRKFVLILLLDF